MNTYPYISIDKNGYLIPIASTSTVRPETLKTALALIEEIDKECDKNLHSIILRGSAACGMEIPKHSDLDIMIFPKEYSKKQKGNIEKLALRLSQVYERTYALIDLSYIDYNELSDMEKNIRMILNAKLTGITLYGEDIVSVIPQIFFDINLAGRIARQAIRETKENINVLKKGMEHFYYMGRKRDIKFLCIWMMRVICRGLIAPVMTHRKVFTLNVETSGKEYISLFPEHEDLITSFLEWEKFPLSNKEEITISVDRFMPQYEKVCLQCGIV